MVCRETPAATTCWPSLPRCLQSQRPGGMAEPYTSGILKWGSKLILFQVVMVGKIMIFLPVSVNVILFGFPSSFCTHSTLTRCLIWNPYISSPPMKFLPHSQLWWPGKPLSFRIFQVQPWSLPSSIAKGRVPTLRLSSISQGCNWATQLWPSKAEYSWRFAHWFFVFHWKCWDTHSLTHLEVFF